MTQYKIRTAMNIRAYGTVTIEADDLNAALAQVNAETVAEKFEPHGNGKDDLDYKHPSDIWLELAENERTGVETPLDLDVADGDWMKSGNIGRPTTAIDDPYGVHQKHAYIGEQLARNFMDMTRCGQREAITGCMVAMMHFARSVDKDLSEVLRGAIASYDHDMEGPDQTIIEETGGDDTSPILRCDGWHIERPKTRHVFHASEFKDPSEMNAVELREYDEARADENEDLVEEMIEAPIDGGKDPERLNEQRKERGRSLAAHVMMLTGTDRQDAVSDAIGYLLHVAEEFGDHGEDAKIAVHRGIQHFNEETGEG